MSWYYALKRFAAHAPPRLQRQLLELGLRARLRRIRHRLAAERAELWKALWRPPRLTRRSFLLLGALGAFGLVGALRQAAHAHDTDIDLRLSERLHGSEHPPLAFDLF